MTVICIGCRGLPCICDYLDLLESGAMTASVVARAASQMGTPHAPATHCPCPYCYRARLASWEEI